MSAADRPEPPGRSAAMSSTASRVVGQARARVVKGLGAPALLAVAMSSVGASVYFALGLVARDALGLTPLVFLGAGVFLVLAIMTYVEGSSLHPERGGASTFARYAFNELWSFVAGWAILLDFVIVMAVSAVAMGYYVESLWGSPGGGALTGVVAALAIAWVAFVNVRGVSIRRLRMVKRLVLLNVVVLGAIVVAGLASLAPEVSLAPVGGGGMPTWQGLVFAAVIATVALTGVEAASGLAGEVAPGRRDLRRAVVVGSAAIVIILVGVSVVGLAAAPPTGGTTELGTRWLGAPMLGVVAGLEPAWLADAAMLVTAVVGVAVLFQAVNANMLGVSRLGYSLATRRQIPPGVGRLHPERSTPWIVILAASTLALGLALSADLELLLGLFAFGAMLAFFLAHLSVIVLRFREPGAPCAFRTPGSVRIRGVAVPIPTVVGALASLAAWISVLVLHAGARYAGLAWMAAGLVLYVAYRRRAGESLTQRADIAESVLRETPEVAYGSILVPVFGRPLDDDIMGTAGRLAAEELDEGEGGPVIEALYVIEMPVSVPIDARVPDEQVAAAKLALSRAKQVGEEYEGVEVATATVRGRAPGSAIVAEAKRRGVEAIVLAAEEPTRVRGGTRLGGLGGPTDRFLGEMTKYVVEKAPCRVVLTAPAREEMEEERSNGAGERGGRNGGPPAARR